MTGKLGRLLDLSPLEDPLKHVEGHPTDFKMAFLDTQGVDFLCAPAPTVLSLQLLGWVMSLYATNTVVSQTLSKMASKN